MHKLGDVRLQSWRYIAKKACFNYNYLLIKCIMFCPSPWLAFKAKVAGCCSILFISFLFSVQTMQSVSGVKCSLVGPFKNNDKHFP